MKRKRIVISVFLTLLLLLSSSTSSITQAFSQPFSHFYTTHTWDGLESHAETPSTVSQHTSSLSAASLYPMKYNFPIEISGWVRRAAPAVADLDLDGTPEIILANNKGDIYVWNYTGQSRHGFPIATNGEIQAHPALGDLTGDGLLEIVIGVSSTTPGVPGKVYVWRHNGTLLPGWPQAVERFGSATESKIRSVALADIDGDLDLEVIAGTNNNINNTYLEGSGTDMPDLYAWHHNGTLVSGWPAQDAPAILGSIAVGDLDGDEQMDVLTGRDYNWLFAYNKNGQDLSGWPLGTFISLSDTGDKVHHKLSAPTVADLEGDGISEYIAAGYRVPNKADTRLNAEVMVFQPNGTRKPGWEAPASGTGVVTGKYDMHQAPTIADLDNNGSLEIVVPMQDGWIRAYRADKTLMWQFNYAQGTAVFANEPAIADLDGDGLNEIVFGTYDPKGYSNKKVGFWMLEHDGSLKSGFPINLPSPGMRSGITLADVDGDSLLEIVAVAEKYICVWETPSPADLNRMPWPTSRHDMKRTGFFNTNDFHSSEFVASPASADKGEVVTLRMRLERTGPASDKAIEVTTVVPAGLSYVPGSLSASRGTVDDSQAPTLKWSGTMSEATLEISYKAKVEVSETTDIRKSFTMNVEDFPQITRDMSFIANPLKTYLPTITNW